MTPFEKSRLVDAVQTNCHIADARGAADLTLCIYLLQMREFYRWEQGLAAQQPLSRDAIAQWLSDRETLWESLEGRDYESLPIGVDQVEPFDVDAVNARLQPHGLVYGAGYVAAGRASFVLAQLEHAGRRGELALRVAGAEHARGLSAPPAALQGSTVLLRRVSLQRWMWEKFEAWRLKRLPGPFKAALDAHGFVRDGEHAVQRLAEAELEPLVLHEIGEFDAGRELGPDWQALRAALPSRRTDLYVRAARDHWADCRVTLPSLLRQHNDASLHFWFANLEGVRALLFPRLWSAYAAWCAGDGGAALRDTVLRGEAHWRRMCLHLLALHRSGAEDAPLRIEECLGSPQWTLH
jgi:Family of unknown function (DUF6866) C-terminal domain/Family of unknown function (DUF6866) N-terminal domain